MEQATKGNVIGGAVGVLALNTPYQIPLAIAIGWIGYSLHRRTLTER